MSTASTKRARKKARAQARERAAREETPAADEAPAAWREAPVVSERTYTYAALAVVFAAALLRLVVLELKPMHHDEGVNGFFLTTLLKQGIYRYDPANYHGPVLYYLTLPSVAILGLNTFAVRLVTAAFGVATVGLMLYLRRYIGAVGALAAAALVAFSPGAVYYSRYFIHETLFVFFTVALVVAALRYRETGEALYLLLAAACAALMFATKETAFISTGVLLLAAGVAWGWTKVTRPPQWDPPPKPFQPYKPAARDDARARPERVGGGARVGLWLAAAAVFVLINVLFYSSFFTNAKGVTDALETFKVWTKTGTSDFHKKD
ncbi:MAG TPA: flippase activity-associated protein Agl23, partial [Pyrinomonadaceae bacterium]